MSIQWNYWKGWDWKKELTNSSWADRIKVPVDGADEVPLRLKDPRDLRLIQTDSEYENLMRNIRDCRFMGFDTEANGLDPFSKTYEIAGLCFAFGPDQGWYLPLNHHTLDAKFNKLFEGMYTAPFRNFDQAKVVRDLSDAGFQDKPIICHNANYELHVEYFLSKLTQFLEFVGHRGPIFDCLFYMRVEDPMRENGLKGSVERLFGYRPIDFHEALGKDAVFNDTDPRKSKDYAAADPVNTFRLAMYCMNQGFVENVYNVCNIVEWPLIKDIADIEGFGVSLNQDKLKEFSELVEPHIERLEREVRRLTRRDFNPRNNKEKYNLLFSELRCPTPDGKPAQSTDTGTLKEIEVYIPSVLEMVTNTRQELETYLSGKPGLSQMLSKCYETLSKANAIYKQFDPKALAGVQDKTAHIKDHVKNVFRWLDSSKIRLEKSRLVIKALRQHTQLFKLYSAFLISMPQKISDQDDLLHTRFNQIVRSGRQSGTTPNLMQLPRDAEYTVEYEGMHPEELELMRGSLELNKKGQIVFPTDVRECILPPPGMVFVCSDWDGMEMRMLAAISRCPVLLSVVLGFDEEGDPYDPHLKSVELMKLMPQPYLELKHILKDEAHKLHKEVKNWRQMIKPINFGLVYGITEFGLAAQLDITPEKAKDLMKLYFETYHGVAKWLQETHKAAEEDGYGDTVLGRRRLIPRMAYEDEHELKHFVRAVGNHLIQGNCIFGDHRVWTPDGAKMLKDVKTNERVWNGNAFVPVKFIPRPEKETKRIELEDGTELFATSDHRMKVWSPEEQQFTWRTTDQLHADDLLCVTTPTELGALQDVEAKVRYEGSNARHNGDLSVKVCEKFGEVLGQYVGDGTYTVRQTRIVFGEDDQDAAYWHRDAINSITHERGSKLAKVITIERPDRKTLYGVQTSHGLWRELLRAAGLDDVSRKDKRTPHVIWSSPEAVRCAYLRGLFDSDGHIGKGGVIGFTTVGESLARETHSLLKSVGILSRLRHQAGCFRIFINAESKADFATKIGFRSIRKKARLDKYLRAGKNALMLDATTSKDVAKHVKVTCKSDSAYVNNVSRGRCFSQAWIKKHLPDDHPLKNVWLMKVNSISDGGIKAVYDLTMLEGPAEFSVEGVTVHNCADIAKFCERQVCDALHERVHLTLRTKQFCNFIHDEFIVACKDDPETVQFCATVLQAVMQKTVSGVMFTATPEVKRNLSKKAKNFMADYPRYDDPAVIQTVANKLQLYSAEDLKFVPWWGAEEDALLSKAA